MNEDDRSLHRFQVALLEVLAEAAGPEAAIAALRAREEVLPFSAWVDGLEPRAVEVGIFLARQWGAREPKGDAPSMKALVLRDVGGALELRDLPIPEPGPGQVRIRVAASGICGTDVHIWRGQYPVPLPIVPGHEPVGTVEALGPGVTALRAGDRVGVPWAQAGCGRCAQCSRGRMRYCAEQRSWVQNGGGHSELMIVEASGCARLPDGLAWEEAAPLLCAGFTAMSGYRNARPRAGDRVAVLGIGGLGHLAIQIARAFGHEVVAITSTESKRAEAIELGADLAIAVGDDAGAALAEVGGADVVLSTSSDTAHASMILSGLRPEGRLVSMGIGAAPLSVDPFLLLANQLSVIGSMQNDPADLADVLELAARGKVRPRVETYPLHLANLAMQRLADGRVRYRAVLVPG